MTMLADVVLPLIRTRSDLYRWSPANAHGRQMHEAVDILEAAIPTTDPAAAGAPVGRLVDWMMKFQFDDDEVAYFELDPVAYAPALGAVSGMATYRKRLAEVEARLGPRPSEDERWTSGHAHEWFALDWNAQRLAVLDRDIEAIIRTHAKDRKVATWPEDTAEAFAEIGEIDLAIDWAKQAVDFGRGHQSLKAADRWCKLLEEHRPTQVLEGRPDPSAAGRERTGRRRRSALSVGRTAVGEDAEARSREQQGGRCRHSGRAVAGDASSSAAVAAGVRSRRAAVGFFATRSARSLPNIGFSQLRHHQMEDHHVRPAHLGRLRPGRRPGRNHSDGADKSHEGRRQQPHQNDRAELLRGEPVEDVLTDAPSEQTPDGPDHAQRGNG